MTDPETAEPEGAEPQSAEPETVAPGDPVLQVQRAALTAIAAVRMLLDALENVALDRDRIERVVETGRAAVPDRVVHAVRDLVGDLAERGRHP